MKKLTLTSLFLAVFIGNAYTNESGQFFRDKIAQQPFFSDSKIDITLRNYGKYLHEDGTDSAGTGNTSVHSAWGQAFGIDYQSGYLANFISFGVSYVNVVKLAASKYFSTRNLLWNDGDGFNKKNAEGFDKVSQRFAKIKLGESDSLNYHSTLGWQVLKNYAVLTTSYQLTKNSYLGYSGTLNYDKYTLETLYITSSMNRDSPEKVQIKTADKKKINHIIGTAVNYKDNNMVITYGYGDADNYIRRHLLELSYKIHPQLTLGSHIYMNNPQENYKQLPSKYRASDHDSWYFELNTKWQQDAMGLTFGVAYTKASKDDDYLGYFERHLTKNARWRFNSLTDAAYHYQRNGELGLTFLGDYQFSKNLISAMQINYGQFNYRDNNIKTGEINIWTQWQPSDKKLKGLSVFAKIGKAWAYRANGTNLIQPILNSNGHYSRANAISGEFIIDYRFNLF